MTSTPSSPPFIVGLTGGIGSGKSAAADLFVAHGASLVDTDAIAHALTAADGAAMPAIRARFGDAVVAADGSLDRAAMRAHVFAQNEARQQLEAILHPMIRAESARQCSAARGSYVILAVPLLIESGGYRARCDRICVVDCPPELQIERVRARSGLEEAQIRAIMAAQASREQRLAAADDVIDNGGSLEHLHAQVAALHARYAALATRQPG
ncbi:dephospho-CoA kinase [Thauera sp. Sel9]|uniref:dephospho-CoA kinase n=1 Tax=Thauera sp. Sel9 TaxID=2974299 RepID=UPI0021E15B8A|nr:dephospho-CoA kinase [Thauera sp. Sel9]MCV2219821.1 dephospho-CoA kinase [Thauera sp. Sel9]